MNLPGKESDPGPMIGPRADACLSALERKVLWLSTWMIHNANRLRASDDGLKAGGPSSLVGLPGHNNDRSLFPCAQATGPRNGEAACESCLSCDPISPRQSDKKRSPPFDHSRELKPIRRAPRTPMMWTFQPALSGSVRRRLYFLLSCRTIFRKQRVKIMAGQVSHQARQLLVGMLVE
jgi:hypothetical protein